MYRKGGDNMTTRQITFRVSPDRRDPSGKSSVLIPVKTELVDVFYLEGATSRQRISKVLRPAGPNEGAIDGIHY